MRFPPLLAATSPVILASIGCASTPTGSPTGSHVELVEHDGKHTLVADGKPHTILGVGGVDNLEMLASCGGNTIRTWDAEGIGPLLDEAHALGIRVVAGIWLEHERHGLNYSDPEERRAELDRVARLVKAHRDHPALLAWGIGNELEMGVESMDTAIRQINDAAALVKRLDPHHPCMAVVAEIGDDKASRIQRECPDIDFLGINAYGGLASIRERLDEQGYTGAWAATEWGVLGHWESGSTPWGAPYEPSSGAKADFLRDTYARAITPNLGESCLGSFAFLWGHKQEKTATWYGLILPTGEKTERVDVLREFWTGTKPEQLAPRVEGIAMHEGDPHALPAGSTVRVLVDASDPNGDALSVEWSVLPESKDKSIGGDFEESLEAVPVTIATDGLGATITMPVTPGAYRVFATVRDGRGGGGTANMPVLVVDENQ